MNEMNENINPIITPKDWENPIKNTIKVIGIGGGGCNAVSYMFEQKVEGCSFIVCNTDSQSLDKSPVPVKIQMGTEGLGAGTNPVEGRKAALEAEEEIVEKVLNEETQMLFITAGMGGGTGTGAAPVIANMAKERGILTVAVVTIPFKNEGRESHARAIDGIRELEKNVDSLMIINNEKLYELFNNQLIHDAFPQADEVLATAVRSITEVIFKKGYINIDFKDVQNMMRNSGMALLGCGQGSGKNRIEDAVKGALESPLLNDFNLNTAKKVLVNITAGKNEEGLLMGELEEINNLISEHTGKDKTFKSGLIYDYNEETKDKIHITVIATGFEFERLKDITDVNVGKLIPLDTSYQYKKPGIVLGKEVSIDKTPRKEIRTVGYSTKENCRTFNFSEDEKPILITTPGENLGELESIPAVRRIKISKNKD